MSRYQPHEITVRATIGTEERPTRRVSYLRIKLNQERFIFALKIIQSNGYRLSCAVLRNNGSSERTYYKIRDEFVRVGLASWIDETCRTLGVRITKTGERVIDNIINQNITLSPLPRERHTDSYGFHLN